MFSKEENGMRATQTNRTPMTEQLDDADALRTLERRLTEGCARIDEAIARGDDVTAWELFWIDLLHQYEAAWDAQRAAA